MLEEGDLQEVQERTSGDLDSSRRHAHGHKERRRSCPISHPQFRRKVLGTDDELGN